MGTHNMILTMDEYIEQHIASKREVSKMDEYMLKSNNCHKYWNQKAVYMQVEHDEDLDNYIFTPLSQQAFDEIEGIE